MGFDRTRAEGPLKASMYFAYGRDARPGLRSRTTFEAVLAGERTSTTRFPQWPGHARWTTLQPGDVIRFYADRAMTGRWVDVEVESVSTIDLSTCGDKELEAWSASEGWSASAGRSFGRRYGRGLQVRYRKA